LILETLYTHAKSAGNVVLVLMRYVLV
jgi:hypothetical protein